MHVPTPSERAGRTMQVWVSHHRLYTTEGNSPYPSLLFRKKEPDGCPRLYALYRNQWYQAHVAGEASSYGFVMPYASAEWQSGMIFVSHSELSLLPAGAQASDAVVYQSRESSHSAISVVPLPPEVREVVFHGVSHDCKQRLVVVRSKYYHGDTTFYRAYLGSSFLSELPRLDFADDQPVRREEGPRYVFSMASSLQLSVSPDARHYAKYGEASFTSSPSLLEFEEGISSLRLKLRQP